MEEANPQGATIEDRIGNYLTQEEPVKEEPVREEQETPEVETEDESSIEDVETEADSEEDAVEAQPQEAQDEVEEAEKFETLSELAEAVGMTVEEFMDNIKDTVKINGVEQELPLSELKKGYQMEADYRRKTAELSEQRKAFEAEREQVAQELGNKYQEAVQITEILENQFMGEYNSIDWNAIKQENPGEWAALKQEYTDRYNQIQNLKITAAQELENQTKEFQRKQLEESYQFLQQEQERLKEIIPEFRDEVKAQELKGQMVDFLKGQGFRDEEIGNIVDHRQVLIIRDAMAYRGLKSKGVEVKNKVTKAPKLQKPGKKSATSEQVQDKKLRSRLKKSGRLEDAINLIKL